MGHYLYRCYTLDTIQSMGPHTITRHHGKSTAMWTFSCHLSMQRIGFIVTHVEKFHENNQVS